MLIGSLKIKQSFTYRYKIHFQSPQKRDLQWATPYSATQVLSAHNNSELLNEHK